MRIAADEIKTMGVLVGEWVARGGDAVVMGVTSKGIYLRFPGDWIGFLTLADYRSPFTVNMLNETTLDLRLGDQVEFAALGWQQRVWAPPQFPPPFAPEILSKQAVSLARQAAKTETTDGLLPYIPYLGGLEDPCPPEGAFTSRLKPFLSVEMAKGGWIERFELLSAFLGQGRGLTPSGDDFAAGFLLAAVRLFRAADLPGFVDGLPAFLARARVKTTYLSATMLYGAAAGLADERLIAMSDCLADPAADLAGVVAGLRTYGSTSGLDALAGCLAAVRIFGG